MSDRSLFAMVSLVGAGLFVAASAPAINGNSAPAVASGPAAHSGSSQLTDEDRRLIEKQKVCPVCGDPLEGHGNLHRISAQSRAVFLCSRQCGECLKDIIVRTVRPPSEGPQPVAGVLTYGITREDFKRLNATIPNIRAALPIRELRQRFASGAQSMDGRLVRCTPKYAELARLEVHRGRFLGNVNLSENRKHCVLAAGTAETLFRKQDPVGQSILIDDSHYVVVGVMKPRAFSAGGSGLLAAQDLTRNVYIPITFERENVQLSQITLRIEQVGGRTEDGRTH